MEPTRRRPDGEDDFIELTPTRGMPPPAESSWPYTADGLLLTPAPFVPPPADPADTRSPAAALGRWAILAMPLCIVAAFVGVYVALGLQPDPAPAPKGKLVVLVAADFLPADKLTAWAGLFGPDGFERMKADGAWLSDVEVPQAFAAAGPGFANLVTGRPPSGHGVVDDQPAEPLGPTVGEALKATGKGKVVAVGLDDRVRNLAGSGADAVVGFDAAAGAFRAVGRPDPEWVTALNARRLADRWHGTAWDRLHPAAVYDAVAGPDSPAGKLPDRGLSFPHPFGSVGPAYRAAVAGSPAGNELVWEAALAAIDGEQLGRRGQVDFLCVGLTAGGPVVRAWGPDGHEAADHLARTDRLLAGMFASLQSGVGSGRWAVVVAGCHGGCPLPEAAKPGQPAGERFDPDREFGQLAAALDDTYGKPGGKPGQWVERVAYPWVTLGRKTLAERKVNPADAAAFAAQWLENRPAAAAAYPRGGPFPDDPVGRAVAAGFHPERGPDVFVVHKPGAVPALAGSASGSPYPYDRAVAVLAVGAGVPKAPPPGRASQLGVAAVLAKLLGVEPPAGAAPAPRGLE